MAMMAITTRSSIRVKPDMAEPPAVAWVLRAGQAVAVKFLFISASTRFGILLTIIRRTVGKCQAQPERILLNARLRQFGQWLQEQNDIKINDMIYPKARFAENIPACFAFGYLPFCADRKSVVEGKRGALR